MESMEERVGVLLRLLGQEVATAVLERVDSARAKQVRAHMGSEEQLNSVLVNEVMDDFDRYLRLSDSMPEPATENAEDDADGDTTSADNSSSEPQSTQPALFVPTQDPEADLDRLEAFQIAGALNGEQPATVALILRRIDPQKAAEALGLLPLDIRPEVILLMNKESGSSPVLVDQILRTVVARGLAIDSNPADAVDQDQRMADLVRSLDRKERGRILERLEESEPEFAERIQKMLFRFEDLERMDDRSIQKLLGTIETSALTKCMASATPQLVAKVLDNMSKRAREGLQEELEFLTRVPEEELVAARDAIGAAMLKLDTAGDLEFED